jgi:hypothetical protein
VLLEEKIFFVGSKKLNELVDKEQREIVVVIDVFLTIFIYAPYPMK